MRMTAGKARAAALYEHNMKRPKSTEEQRLTGENLRGHIADIKAGKYAKQKAPVSAQQFGSTCEQALEQISYDDFVRKTQDHERVPMDVIFKIPLHERSQLSESFLFEHGYNYNECDRIRGLR